LDRLSPDDMLAQVREHLAFVLEHAQEKGPGSLPNAAHLLHLSDLEAHQIGAIHLLTHDVTAAFCRGLNVALRSLPRTTQFERTESRTAVRGSVNWSATAIARAQAGLDPTLHISTPPFRAFDVLETRLIRRVVTALSSLLIVAAPVRRAEGNWKWERAINDAVAAQVLGLRHRSLMSATDLHSPLTTHLARASTSRSAFVRHAVVPWLERFEAQFERAKLDRLALQALLAETAFVSMDPGRLLELLVLFHLVRGFADLSSRFSIGLLAPGRRDVFAAFDLQTGGRLEIRYQRRPDAEAQADVVLPALRWYGLPTDAGRPDIVIERVDGRHRRMILEVKDTDSAGYLADGMYQLSGYIRAFQRSATDTIGVLVSWRESLAHDPPSTQEPDLLNNLRAATLETLMPLTDRWLNGRAA
jgi:hypothetical protein